jgi:hypothetical protein
MWRKLPGWCLSWALGWGCLLGRLGRLGFLAIFAEVDKSYFVGNNLDLRFFLACGLILPCFLFESAFNMQAQPFGEEFTAVLGSFPKNSHVNEVGFFMFLVLVVIPYPVQG